MNTFKFYFLTFCVFVCMTGCSQPRYVLVTDNEFYKICEKYDELPYKRYVIVPVEKYKDKEDISYLLQNTYDFLKRKDYDSLELFLAGYKKKSHGCYIYAQALFFQFRSNTSDALQVIENVNFDDCRCYAYILKADLFSETNQKKQFDKSLELYQKAIDCLDDNSWKELIKARIRILRYEK